MNWDALSVENMVAGVVHRYRESSNYGDNGVKWLLLNSVEVGKDDKKLRGINQQLKSKCESQIAYKEAHVFWSEIVENAEAQAQDLILRVVKLQKRLKLQVSMLCSESCLGKNGSLHMEWSHLRWCTWNPDSLDSSGLTEHWEVAHFSLIKAIISPSLER